MKLKASGFTLLEILVALALMGIALLVVIQLFGADLRGIAASEDYVVAASRAEARMREILDDDAIAEKSWSETPDEGYRIEASIRDVLKDRTDDLQVKLLEVALTIHWSRGAKERSLTLTTMKMVNKG